MVWSCGTSQGPTLWGTPNKGYYVALQALREGEHCKLKDAMAEDPYCQFDPMFKKYAKKRRQRTTRFR